MANTPWVVISGSFTSTPGEKARRSCQWGAGWDAPMNASLQTIHGLQWQDAPPEFPQNDSTSPSPCISNHPPSSQGFYHPTAHAPPGQSQLMGLGTPLPVPLGSLQIQSSWASHCIGIHCREARSSTAQLRMSSSS